VPISNVTNALDLKGLADVKRQAHEGSAEGTRKAAREFEAMFLSMMLKGMRESLSHDDPLESDATRMATSMYDGQLAQSMAGKGLGLADAIVKQIERSQALKTPASTNGAAQSTGGPILLKAPAAGAIPLRHGLLLDNVPAQIGPVDSTTKHPEHSLGRDNQAPIDEPSVQNPRTPEGIPAPLPQTPRFKTGSVQQNFVDMHRQAAEAASRASGIPTKVILGQAALESGWGRHEARDASGTGSFNLFGIKAGKTWKGATVDSVTTEFVSGVAQKVVQKFRAYTSYAESFLDHAKMVTNNPRYDQVMQVANDAVRFAKEMGRSGYATDPRYGEKLTRILSGPLRDVA
jgi:flagellar protein FlgJ